MWIECRLEVYNGTTWGTVCDDQFNEKDATVACRMFTDSSIETRGKYSSAEFGQGFLPILFDNLQCHGNESSLFNCTHAGIGTHNCGHSEDVGIYCRWKDLPQLM